VLADDSPSLAFPRISAGFCLPERSGLNVTDNESEKPNHAHDGVAANYDVGVISSGA
jgi:hypothetical protein